MNKRVIAIIGTAGRDQAMHVGHWNYMVRVAQELIGSGESVHLVSGGAAWADHVAVELFRTERVAGLTLHLPAPFLPSQGFVGPAHSSGSAANYYHSRFSKEVGRNTLSELANVLVPGRATWSAQAAREGYGAMKTRNLIVARAPTLIAFTFGDKEPTDGGTGHTWRSCKGNRIHVSLKTGHIEGAL